jgi:AcrR family transcriptional regulator
MAGDWLADRRSEVAADRILDAASELFAHRDAAAVGMNEIARAAGCSRATLYRYFETRDALHTSYAHREAQRLYGRLTEQIGHLDDPRSRLTEGIVVALRSVRENPALASWFAASDRPIGGEMAGQSEVVHALVSGFVQSLGVDDADTAGRQARWLLRVMTSLLMFPGRDEAEERGILADFVVPLVISGARQVDS